MSQHPHLTLAKKLWNAASRGDPQEFGRLLDPDIVWESVSSGVLDGSYKGPDGVLDLLARSGELVDDLKSELIDVFVNEDGAILHYHVQAARAGKALDTDVLLRMRFEHGRAVAVFSVPVDAVQSARFWTHDTP